MLRSYGSQSPAADFLLPHVLGAETLRGRNSFSTEPNRESGKGLNNIVKAYPNPTSDKITIAWDFSYAGQGNVELFDITGRLVLRREFNCNSGSCELSMHNFPSGLYTYKLSLESDVFTGKIIKND